ncbi:MAG: SEC-C metal-binding domain-containing protein [Alphaproteobacteria bacterium]
MKIVKSKGLNESENRLTKLGDKVFLDLWSYPNVFYKDKTPKEFADLLVVCGNNIIIFSDKEIKFNKDIDIAKAWRRWENKAILSSIKQLNKAEHRLINHKDRLFLDAKYTQPFPIDLPNIENMKIYLICVANGVKSACEEFYGPRCSGSLRFTDADLDIGESALSIPLTDLPLFRAKDYNCKKRFIHVFDDVTLPFVLDKLDTITDFVEYLDKKETFLRCGASITYTGEEDLLLIYLANKKSFPYNKNVNKYFFSEEDWFSFESRPDYRSKILANHKSYTWDRLIKTCAMYRLNDEGKTVVPKGKEKHEGALRYMALEHRLGRRFIAERLHYAFSSYNLQEEKDAFPIHLTYFTSLTTPNLWYVILQIPQLQNETYDKYRERRAETLSVYCQCAKAKAVSEGYILDKVVGIALEPPKQNNLSMSEDLMLVDFNNWSEENQKEFENVRKILNIFTVPLDAAPRAKVQEYPFAKEEKKKIKRNSDCPCGSGKKYKKCCLINKRN